MKTEDVLETVKTSIADSCGIPLEKIELDTPLFSGLGIDSIDLVDILYSLEKKYRISLKISDINKNARKELGNKPFDNDGVITEEGITVLRKLMPEIAPENFKQGLSVYDLMQLLTVHSLCNMVLYKLQEKEQ